MTARAGTQAARATAAPRGWIHRILFAALAAAFVGPLPAPLLARTKAETQAIKAAEAVAAARVRLQAQLRARAETQLRARQRAFWRARLTAIMRANAMAEQRRAAAAVAAAARAQKDISDASKAARQPPTALANYRKWAGNRLVWHHFQGTIPPEELRRFERDQKHEDADKRQAPAAGCATAGADGAPKPANCEKAGS